MINVQKSYGNTSIIANINTSVFKTSTSTVEDNVKYWKTVLDFNKNNIFVAMRQIKKSYC